MKTTILKIAVFTALLICVSSFAQQNGSKIKIAHNNAITNTAEFLIDAAQGRMIDTKLGKMATEKGSSAIRGYGELIVRDQIVMLEELKTLALAKQIILPKEIDPKREKGRENLIKKSGKDFDFRFIKIMVSDQRRDVRIFESAAQSNDASISAFAKKYLPMIRSHLDKSVALAKSMRVNHK